MSRTRAKTRTVSTGTGRLIMGIVLAAAARSGRPFALAPCAALLGADALPPPCAHVVRPPLPTALRARCRSTGAPAVLRGRASTRARRPHPSTSAASNDIAGRRQQLGGGYLSPLTGGGRHGSRPAEKHKRHISRTTATRGKGGHTASAPSQQRWRSVRYGPTIQQ